MATPIDYIEENKLQWQPSFKGSLKTAGRFGYRGDLIITQGEFLSPQKQLPPKVIFKQALVVADEKSAFLFAANLEDFANFEKAFELYKALLVPTTIVTLFVDNLISDCVFEYEGITVYAFALDESSVWNELISYADLDKKELKRMDADDKLDAIYDGLKVSTLYAAKKTYEEACALKMG
ncbi:MAG: hypothetical protein GW906_04405 [Epsilonproteobacteria bacterium]|nr:hypothetical protein [Campylobacterota bacterium]OIO17662.1 MAG: hypothetical protein AUJ81_01370 [Helicobacteraceae bacterium CG1_02_36_14]PIP09654.1 MAG: hypothetical protein COX50_09770 [Sulfurimonas sp. CG23_combo_of_CG06-09_8_20_14_all_36_33]PIS26199.1 MAG: hypothetical protein COT46_03440 [Sulfurimonas sp. CG08_land_8_20_14_0_20_36_33]PIU34283.1 MAG: hypothetical protein COT05_08230 [Sulfurimonas sp. CG07_land_8_20_14_0_80_36_56]PIV02581.1 MAG: hypothetical protein COS56_11375 [Sulfur